MNRRTFLATTTAGALSAAAVGRVRGANDRIRLGIIGTGSRGRYLMRQANEVGGIEWIAVSDVWDRRREQGAGEAGAEVALLADYTEMLARDDVDAVIVATPDHHHAHITAEACRAGKDVFVEKPMTSLPMQGHEVIRAVEETGRVVQVGMQQRSMPHFIEAKERFFDSGLIGDVHMVRTIWNANGGYLVEPPPSMERKPDGLDWEAYLGWLPKIPWDPKRYFNRFAYWDISTGGQTGGLFVHMVDVVHWYLDNHRPDAAVAAGGIYQYVDGRDTPDNVNLALEYPGGVNVTFEATLTDMIPERSADIVFMGTGGRLSIFRYGYHFLPAKENQHVGELRSGGSSATPHMANWLSCIRSREQPNADVYAGHYSSMACHIGNEAYRARKRAVWRDEWTV